MAIKTNTEPKTEIAIASATLAAHANLAEIEAQIRELQAEAMRTFFDGAVRVAGKILRTAGWFVVAVWDGIAYARAYEQLSGLDDSTLVRMGLKREELADHVYKNVYEAAAAVTEPTLEAISGGKAATGKPIVETPERRAA